MSHASGRRPLTTTSYAVLGLLSLREWTTYELAEQMRRALGLFWPRAISGIYEEPKKLVAHGLAAATQERVGRRGRTRYSITRRGQRALEAWLPTAGVGPQIEFEQLIKVFFAEHGSKTDLLAHLEGIRRDIAERAASNVGIPHEYLDGAGGYPERLPWLILVGKFLDDFEQMVDSWATWATSIVEGWPDDLTKAEPDLAALREMADNADAFVRLLQQRWPNETTESGRGDV
jgi:DNA-binding PadR family transcriptional regulator